MHTTLEWCGDASMKMRGTVMNSTRYKAGHRQGDEEEIVSWRYWSCRQNPNDRMP